MLESYHKSIKGLGLGLSMKRPGFVGWKELYVVNVTREL